MYGARLEDVQKEEEEKNANLAKMHLELEKNEKLNRNKKRKEGKTENKENLFNTFLSSKDGWDDLVINELELINGTSEVKVYFQTIFINIILKVTKSIGGNDGWSDADLEMDDIPEQEDELDRGNKVNTYTENIYDKEQERTEAYEPLNKGFYLIKINLI